MGCYMRANNRRATLCSLAGLVDCNHGHKFRLARYLMKQVSRKCVCVCSVCVCVSLHVCVYDVDVVIQTALEYDGTPFLTE